MPKKREQFLFDWRRAVASSAGPSKGPTRHVLLTLSLHMDQDGGSCYPSTRLLEEETGITRKTVERHLREADGEWIERIERGGEGRSWKRYEYRARYPDGWSPPPPEDDEGGVRRTPPQAGEVESEVPHVSTEGGVAGTPPQTRDVEYDVPHPDPDGGVRGTPPADMAGGVIDDLRWSNSRPEVEYDVPLRASRGRQEDVVTPSIQPPPSPQVAGPREDREVDDDFEEEIRRWQPTARANIVAIHGSEDDVVIAGQPVGVGIDVNRYKRVCRTMVAPPEIVALAIAEVPTVTGLVGPVSLALWESDDGGPELLHRCIGRAWSRAGGEPLTALVDLERMRMPQPSHDELERARSGR